MKKKSLNHKQFPDGTKIWRDTAKQCPNPKCHSRNMVYYGELDQGKLLEVSEIECCPSCGKTRTRKTRNPFAADPKEGLERLKRRLLERPESLNKMHRNGRCPQCGQASYAFEEKTPDEKIVWKICLSPGCSWPGAHSIQISQRIDP
jgi:ribosomal protein L37E